MVENLPIWRSLLYVPINVQKFIDKAGQRDADCVLLDLEDSIPSHEKEHARRLVRASASMVRAGGSDVGVRINFPIELAVRDIEHAVIPEIDVIAVAKVHSASHLQMLDDLVSRLEAQRGIPVGKIRFIVLVETAAAFFQLHAVTHAVPRTAAIALGGEDFSLDCNMVSSGETLLYPKQHMIVAAASAGILPLGFIGSIAEIGDQQVFREMARRSKKFGFAGATCVHPDQVAIINEEYSPTGAEVDYAYRVVELNHEAEAEGRASFQLDGRMIDAPIVRRAQQLLVRHEAILLRERRRHLRQG